MSVLKLWIKHPYVGATVKPPLMKEQSLDVVKKIKYLVNLQYLLANKHYPKYQHFKMIAHCNALRS